MQQHAAAAQHQWECTQPRQTGARAGPELGQAATPVFPVPNKGLKGKQALAGPLDEHVARGEFWPGRATQLLLAGPCLDWP